MKASTRYRLARFLMRGGSAVTVAGAVVLLVGAIMQLVHPGDESRFLDLWLLVLGVAAVSGSLWMFAAIWFRRRGWDK
jgi:hypothetical protein